MVGVPANVKDLDPLFGVTSSLPAPQQAKFLLLLVVRLPAGFKTTAKKRPSAKKERKPACHVQL